MEQTWASLKRKNRECVRNTVIRRWGDESAKWFCLLHMRVNTQTLSGAKNLGAKESIGNKAACVIELGNGLPTISQLSNEQGL